MCFCLLRDAHHNMTPGCALQDTRHRTASTAEYLQQQVGLSNMVVCLTLPAAQRDSEHGILRAVVPSKHHLSVGKRWVPAHPKSFLLHMCSGSAAYAPALQAVGWISFWCFQAERV